MKDRKGDWRKHIESYKMAGMGGINKASAEWQIEICGKRKECEDGNWNGDSGGKNRNVLPIFRCVLVKIAGNSYGNRKRNRVCILQ